MSLSCRFQIWIPCKLNNNNLSISGIQEVLMTTKEVHRSVGEMTTEGNIHEYLSTRSITKMEKKRIPHCRNTSKIVLYKHGKRCTIYDTNTHDRSISWSGTDTSKKVAC